MTSLVEFGLESDPFSLIVQDGAIHHWAGRERERELLLDVAESVRASDIGTSEFVLLHGEYGAGKSHALKWLATQINQDQSDHFKGKAIYLGTIRVAQKVTFQDVYKTIIDLLGSKFFDELAATIHGNVHAATATLIQSLGKAEAAALFGQGSQRQATLDKFVPQPLRSMVELLLLHHEGDQRALSYLRGEKVIFKELGINSPIDDDFTAVSALASLFKVMCLQIDELPRPFEAVYLFVDEQENLVDMKAGESGQLIQSFRELLNQLPLNFCMIWGATADAALLEAVLPASILQRLTRKYVELSDLLPDKAKAFLKQHLADVRVEGYVAPQPFYPFSEEAVDLVLDRVVGLTPRNMFRSLRAVLERAVRRHGLKPPAEISATLAQEILDLQA